MICFCCCFSIEEVKRALLGRIEKHLNKARKRGKGVLHLEFPEFSPHEIKEKDKFFPLFGLSVVFRPKFLAQISGKNLGSILFQ